MPNIYGDARKPLGLRSAYEVLAQHIESARTHESCQSRYAGDAQRNRGCYYAEVEEAAPPGARYELELQTQPPQSEGDADHDRD